MNNSRIISSATGQIKQLFLHYQNAGHQLDIIEKFVKTVTKGTEVIILVGDKRHEKKLKKNLASINLNNYVIRLDKRMKGASKWLRDPFIIVKGNQSNQLHLVERGKQRKEDRDVAEAFQPKLQNASIVEESCFLIDGGNILADEDFVMIGANQFTKLICCLKGQNYSISKEELKDKAIQYIKSSLGLPQSCRIICIGNIDWGNCLDMPVPDPYSYLTANSNKEENLFSPELWFHNLSPKVDKANFDKLLQSVGSGKKIITVNKKQKENIFESLKEHDKEEPILGKKILELPVLSRITERIKAKVSDLDLTDIELLELVRQLLTRGALVHIDLFISLTGLKKEGKYIVFLAEARLLHPEHETPISVIEHRDKINKYLSKVKKQLEDENFLVERLPMPIIHRKGLSDWLVGFYNNNLVENIDGQVKIWYPKLSTSALFDKSTRWVIRKHLAEIEEEILHRFQKYPIKAYGVQSRNYGTYIGSWGAIHCITKETRFDII